MKSKTLIMKQLVALFGFVFLLSCNNDDTADNTTTIDPTLLQKVVFAPGNAVEKHWNFYLNGLLKEITQPDGTVLQSFTYDANGNLLASAGHTFTYDSSNIITTVDGYPVSYGYDAAGGKYTFEYEVPAGEDAGIDFPHKTEIVVNSDLLPLTRRIFFNYPEGEVYFTPLNSVYQNGNLRTAAQQGGDTYQRYEYNSGANPLKTALLPVCRAMGLVDGNSQWPNLGNWQNGNFSSNNLVVHLQYALEDPESNTFTYTVNALGLPTSQISQYYDFGVPGGEPITSIHYYYQGDVVP
jgi:hypothetical protein